MALFARSSTQTRDAVVTRLRSVTSPRPVAEGPTVAQPIIFEAEPRVIAPLVKLVMIGILVVTFGAWLNRPHSDMISTSIQPGLPVSLPSTSAISAGVTTDLATGLVVDVEGDVVHHGLVHLPAGSRIADAIHAAGGTTQHIAPGQINLAERVTDGQLIVVGAASGAQSPKDLLVNLNQASATDLDALPGVGPVMASRIVQWRIEHSSFKSIDELQEVPGIGPKVFANLKPLVRI